MPAQVRQAMFQPISPLLNLKSLVEETPNFEYVVRIHRDSIDEQGIEAFEKLVLLHVILGGKPLVIEGFEKSLPTHLFSPSWLDLNKGRDFVKSRDLTKQDHVDISIGHYLKHMPKLTDQYTATSYQDPKRQRLYLKDIDCPEAWFKYLEGLIPSSLFYLNESTGEPGGPGAVEQSYGHYGSQGKGAAPAGDLMSSLPEDMRAENMMCYIGHEGTYTPAHREMCASLGHNIMVEASGNGLDPWGKQEKEGSSIWFMTETKDRFLVSEYWLSILGHDIEVESHFAQINAWINAPFTTYIVEQKVGDFILIPPLAPHQVWNRGTRTMKAAWNRTTVDTLEMALNEALPRARMVCRDEQYKNKAIIYFTLAKYSKLLDRIEAERSDNWTTTASMDVLNSRKVRQLRKDFRRLFYLFSSVMLSEMFFPKEEKNVQFLPFESIVTCAYCRCNIFNRFLTCESCVGETENGEQDAYDVCMECYAMGRSCGCVSNLKWVEQFRWKELVQSYDEWRMLVIDIEGGVNGNSPQPLQEARKRLGKKTLAQICQEQLRLRPWCDITKPLAEQIEPSPERDDEDAEAEEDGRRKKKRRKSKRTEKWLQENSVCHICKERHPNWKMASCDCGFHYCYGVLYRAFDLMPQEIMEVSDWKCPRCKKICSCAACRKYEEITPYDPKGTLVGHDTKRVADPRSVETLVDYSRSNLYWISKGPREERPYDSVRLQRRREEAQLEKSRDETLNESYVDDDDEDAMHDDYAASQERFETPLGGEEPSQRHMPIDPRLGTDGHQDEDSHGQDAFSHQPLQSSRISLPSPSAMINGASALPKNSRHPLPPNNHGNQGDRFSHTPNQGLGSDRYQQSSVAGTNNALYEHDDTQHQGPPSGFVAPLALMMGNGNENDEQGNSEDAPYDVDESTDQIPSRISNSNHSQSLDMANSAGRNPKRRRDRSHSQTNNNDGSGEMLDANRQFQQAQLQKTLTEAKRNNSYNITQARLQGKRKVVKFALSRDQLGDLPQLAGDEGAQRQPLQPRDAGPENEDEEEMTIVRSDARPVLTSDANADSDLEENADEEEEGSSRKRRRNAGNKGSSLRQSGTSSKKNRRAKGVTAEDSTDDEEDADHQDEAETLTSRPKKRRESAWLARKRQEEPDEFPTELSHSPKRRRPSLKKAPQEPANEPADEESDVEVDENYEPVVRTARTTASAANSKEILNNGSQGSNLDAKLRALRFAEGQVSDIEENFSPSASEDEQLDVSTNNTTTPKSVKVNSQRKTKINGTSQKAAVPTSSAGKNRRNGNDSPKGKGSPSTSIFSRPSMQGKRIKIVSAKNASNTPSGSSAKVSTPVAGKGSAPSAAGAKAVPRSGGSSSAKPASALKSGQNHLTSTPSTKTSARVSTRNSGTRTQQRLVNEDEDEEGLF